MPVSPRTVGRPIASVRALSRTRRPQGRSDVPSRLLPAAASRALGGHASPASGVTGPAALAPTCAACWPSAGRQPSCRAASAGLTAEEEEEVDVEHRRRPASSESLDPPRRWGRRARPRRRRPATCDTSTDNHGSDGSARVKFKGLITKSFLCVRCKGKGASRAARAQCAYPILSAKRRHQLRHVDHRVGGAEHLWQHRQSARGEHKGSATAGPLRLVRAAHRDGWARGACGTRVPWLASMVQGPDGPRESARRQPPYLGRTWTYHLK